MHASKRLLICMNAAALLASTARAGLPIASLAYMQNFAAQSANPGSDSIFAAQPVGLPPLPVQPAVPTPPPTDLNAPSPASGPAPTAPSAAKPADRRSAQNDALEDEISPELETAVTKGIAALVRTQRKDGSFGDGPFGGNVAITSLACLALMSDGHTPGRGVYGENVSRGLEFILKSCDESGKSGLIASDSANGPMYGHGFATLFLGEVYGMTAGGGDTALAARVHEALVKAVRLIQTTQNDEGGWRYNPVPYDADISVTICQIMALRSARNAGLEIPKVTIDKAVEYVRACQNANDGGFRYQVSQGPSLWPRSAAGVASLFYAGIYTDEAINKGINYLMQNALPGHANAQQQQLHYFYGHYYAVQAMFLAGGDSWARWWPAIRTELLSKQHSDGLWDDTSVGNAYGTSMSLIILQMPKRYLPIFQK